MPPILAAMRRNALASTLIAVQIALTLAILSNALFIIHERLVSMARPSGVDESQLFAIQNQWVGEPHDVAARAETDLAALRALPSVVDAYVTNAYPLSGVLFIVPVTLHPDDKSSNRLVGMYFGDSHTLRTLGLRLIVGRNFSADDVQNLSGALDSHRPPGGIMVSQQLADSLAPKGNVIGRQLTVRALGVFSAPIVAVVQDLQVAGVHPPGFLHLLGDESVLISYRDTAAGSYYVVRAQSAPQLGSLMRAATARLYAVNGLRVVGRVESMSDARQRAYRGDRGQAVMLATVSAILLAMTGWGIVGLTSCWVNQRRRHIGIRRAMGATPAAIVYYFQTENLLIAAAGVAAGVGLAIAANLWMISRFQMDRLDYRYVLLGAVVVLALGQLATLWPALRAASVPPAEAARSA